MAATMYGWEMVWPAPMGRGWSSLAAVAGQSTNRCRGTARRASSTRRFRHPAGRDLGPHHQFERRGLLKGVR